MKTLAVILLCLWPWTVRGQYELPTPNYDTLVVRLPTGGDIDDSIQVGDFTFIAHEPPLTRADVQRMIDSTVAARIAELGRWEMRIEWRGGHYAQVHDSLDFWDTIGTIQWVQDTPDTTWVFVRPEEKP